MEVFKNWLAETDYELLSGSVETAVDEVIYDSRKARAGAVFVCIKGARADGHAFIKEVYDRGVRAFVLQDTENLPLLPEAVILRVKDTRKALAELSAARFGWPLRSMISVGITGTKGKTTTSTMLRTVLEACGEKTGLIGTNGCFIGEERIPTINTTPESYELQADFRRMADAGCRYVVMECSSQGFKLDRTWGLRFDYGVFLNISPDHIGKGEHQDFEEYLNCKAMLLSQSRTALLNRDDPHTEEILQAAERKPEKVLWFSVKQKADQTCGGIRYLSGTDFTGSEFDAAGLYSGSVRVPLPGYFNIENTLPVLMVSALCGLSPEGTAAGVLATRVNGRMEVVFRSGRFTILVDYAHNEVSMVSLLETLRRDYRPERLVVLFGCGGNRSKDRRVTMGKAAAESADFTIITSDNPRYEEPSEIIRDIYDSYLASGGKPENCARIESRQEAIRFAMEHAQTGDMIAVIGKGHEDYIEQNGVRTHFLDREAILEEKERLGL